jgi:hypothetical protein
MALSPREERAFGALIADFDRVRTARRRAIGWTLLILACLGAIATAGTMRIPWLATLGWLGLIGAGLAGVAAPARRG